MRAVDVFGEKVEHLLGLGGTKKDVVLLGISAIALVLSFFAPEILPVNPAWIAIVLCGIPIILEAVVGLVTAFDITADVLVSLALIASVLIGEYFAAGEVAVIMQVGSLLEDLTVARARAGIEELVHLTPRTARVVDETGERVIPAEDVRVNDRVRILPGETVPVDGTIVSGQTSIDESVMTGEPLPCDKGPGDEVRSGTVNQFGAFEMRAERVGEDSSIARMVALVQSADASKAKIVRLADRWATWIVVIALVAAAGTWFVTGEIIRAVTILVVFCPCSLVLATPTAIMAAIGNVTKFGVLVREGDALERLAHVKSVTFDKTGTLTYGKPHVVAVRVADSGKPVLVEGAMQHESSVQLEGSTQPEGTPQPEGSAQRTSPAQLQILVPSQNPMHTSDLDDSGREAAELLRLVAAAESMSEHPLGKAIVAGWKEHQTDTDSTLPSVCDFEMTPGRGVTACVDGKHVLAGNLEMLRETDVEGAADADAMGEEFSAQGCTVVYAAVDGKIAGVVALADTVREDATATVAGIKALDVDPVLLTGDHAQAAQAIADAVGISEVRADCLPEDKMDAIGELQQAGDVCMVGDGINDAPALKSANVGIAMGGVGSDIAVDAADIALVRDNISSLPHLLALARRMMSTIKLNLTFSMTLNFVAIILAMTGILNPVVGALVHNAGSVLVIVNSATLLGWHRKGLE